MRNNKHNSGFTLIELSIVLVIIGLIVGGVLVGRDLIKSAEIRSQISQIEKYNTAVNTFRVKYGFLPGDMPDPYATQFGFQPRGAYPGMGNGDGVIAGFSNPSSTVSNTVQSGETTAFWVDLSTANLIDGTFNTASPGNINNGGNCVITTSTVPSLNNYFPTAKIGNGNYVVVYSGGWSRTDSTNYFNIISFTSIACWSTSYGISGSSAAMSVLQAYSIDSKIDDGLPQSGKVLALLAPGHTFWAGNGSADIAPYTTATAGTTSSCFDNSTSSSGTPGVNGNVQHYSIEINNGIGVNCALSFKFQ